MGAGDKFLSLKNIFLKFRKKLFFHQPGNLRDISNFRHILAMVTLTSAIVGLLPLGLSPMAPSADRCKIIDACLACWIELDWHNVIDCLAVRLTTVAADIVITIEHLLP
jgi:hypothetical protein